RSAQSLTPYSVPTRRSSDLTDVGVQDEGFFGVVVQGARHQYSPCRGAGVKVTGRESTPRIQGEGLHRSSLSGTASSRSGRRSRSTSIAVTAMFSAISCAG